MMSEADTTPNASTVDGDLSPVVARIHSVEQILQIKGSFERFPLPPERGMDVRFSEPVVRARLTDPNRIMVLIERTFDARLPKPAEQEASDEAADGPAGGSDRIAHVAATFLVFYRLKPGPELKVADVNAFARQNGVFNVTPYWREYLSSSLVRAGLPAFMAPVMKLGPEAQPPTDAEGG